MRPCDVFRLAPAAFGSETSCLGEQLVALLRTIRESRPDLRWYVADLQTIGPCPVAHREPTPTLIGDAGALVQAVGLVDQFESGVFAGVASSIDRPAFRAGGLYTEDDEVSDLGDAAVEVRAFDTSYWSIATTDPNLAKTIRGTFGRGEPG
jgi:hypothetical protein